MFKFHKIICAKIIILIFLLTYLTQSEKYRLNSDMHTNTKNFTIHTLNSKNNILRWAARPCMEKHYFVCQHRMPYVNDKNRQLIYNKWNETYPNEMANEIEVFVSNGEKTLSR